MEMQLTNDVLFWLCLNMGGMPSSLPFSFDKQRTITPNQVAHGISHGISYVIYCDIMWDIEISFWIFHGDIFIQGIGSILEGISTFASFCSVPVIGLKVGYPKVPFLSTEIGDGEMHRFSTCKWPTKQHCCVCKSNLEWRQPRKNGAPKIGNVQA